jgi:predicted helicase
LIERGREKIMNNFLNGDNLGLVTSKQCVNNWKYVFITNRIGDFNLTSTAGRFGSGSYFPLYLYLDSNRQQTLTTEKQRKINLNEVIVYNISKKLDLAFSLEVKNSSISFTPIHIFDYVYAILHSPAYRERFKEFLKIDFPRIPYPKDKETFCSFIKLGGELRQVHLLESPVVNKFITTYPVNGSNEVTKLRYENGKVWINNDQYFDGIPKIAWEFYIGGYQPAQKWLKDRKGRVLSFEDTMHYQKIIVALYETDRIMKEIDLIDFLE